MGHTKVYRKGALDAAHTGKTGDLLERKTRGFESHDTDRPSDVLDFGFDWLTLKRVEFALKYTCRLLFRVGSLAIRRQEKSHTYIKRYPWIVWPGIKDSQRKPQLRSDAANK